MHPSEYDKLAELDRRHWWYLGLQRLVLMLSRPWLLKPDCRVLDAGCGTGGMLLGLGDAAARMGMDLSPLAPGRERALSEEELKTACRLQYARHYWERVPAG